MNNPFIDHCLACGHMEFGLPIVEWLMKHHFPNVSLIFFKLVIILNLYPNFELPCLIVLKVSNNMHIVLMELFDIHHQHSKLHPSKVGHPPYIHLPDDVS
jgi:hypothetical protein